MTEEFASAWILDEIEMALKKPGLRNKVRRMVRPIPNETQEQDARTSALREGKSTQPGSDSRDGR